MEGENEVRATLKKQHGIVVSKDPIERFGNYDETRNNVVALRKSCVVHADITNNRLWGFFIWGYHPNSHIDKIKPKRFVVLRDELKLACSSRTRLPPHPRPRARSARASRPRSIIPGSGRSAADPPPTARWCCSRSSTR